ncbi:MAG: tyrosine-type recombinase/integrase [Desulfovibrionaceae bacterium]|nr:tyrosine-type recombinase/integrase [Desulfovibrionaceae bacterium]
MKIIMSKLSEYDVKHAPSRVKVYKLGDGGRLWLFIHPNGQKIFRVLWRRQYKQYQFTIGAYPKVSLKKARLERDRITGLLAQGLNPSLSKEHLEVEQRLLIGKLTFKAVALEWFEKRTTSLDPDYRKSKWRRLERYVLPAIGDTPIQQVKYRDLIGIVQQIEAANHPEMVRRVVQLLNQIFRYAKIMEYVEHNMAEELKDVISLPCKGEHRPAIVEPSEISQLLKDINGYQGYSSVQYALKIMPYVFVRSQELRLSTWDEINWEEGLWIIPASHMKKKREHVVPLAKQVINLFKELQSLQGESRLVFPSMRNAERCISDDRLLKSLRSLGYAGEKMCIHGFRSMASTRLNEMGFRSEIIEMQLAHMEENKVRAAYNRALYLEERRAMMQKWADYLDDLREADCSKPLKDHHLD